MTDEMTNDAKSFAEQIKKLADAFVSINLSLSLDETLKNITEQARQIIGAHQSVTSLTIEQNWAQSKHTVSHSDKITAWMTDEESPDLSGIYHLICLHNKPMRLTQAELEAHPVWSKFREKIDKFPPMRGWLVIPLIARDGQNIGLLQLSDKYEGEFSESDEALLVQLARVGSMAIENVLQVENVKKNDRALREREEKLKLTLEATQVDTWTAEDQIYRTLFENNPLPTYIYDPETLLFLAVNNAAIREYGYSAKEFRLLKLNDIQLEQNEVQNTDNSTSTITGHKRGKHQKKNGRIVEVEYTTKNIVFAGKPAILITTTDFSIPQLDTQSLDQELYLLRTLINKLPGYIYAKDRESRFVFANMTVAGSKGQKRPEDLIGKSDFDYYPPDLASQYFAVEQEIMRSGQGIINSDIVDRDENGNETWSSNTKVPWVDGKGNVIGILGINFDITEYKLAEAALRESEQRYRKLFESNPHPMWVYDVETLAIKAVNEEAIRHYGYSKKEFLGKTIKDMLAEEDTTQFPEGQPIDDVQLSLKSFLKHKKKDGTIIDVEVISHEVILEGHKVRLDLVNDITERKRAEEELRDSEQRYRTLFDNNPHPMWVYDVEALRILAVNQAAIQHYGYTKEEFLSKTILDMHPGEEISRLLKVIPRDFETLTPKSYWLHKKKDGTTIDVEVTFHGLVFDGHKARLGLINDITERKRAEKALRDSEQRYRELFENNPHPMFFYDIETLAILAVNNAMVAHYGYTREEFLQMTLKDIRPVEDIPTLLEDLASFTSNIHINSRRRHKKKDGTIFNVEGTSHDILFEGRKARLVMVNDITERQRVEEERDRFFTVSLDMLCIAGFDGYFKRLNPTWKKTLGFTNEELMSKPFIEFVHPEDRQQTLEQASNLSDGHKVLSFENRYLSKNGSYRWLLWSATAYPEQQLIFAVAHDITERKKAEEALSKTEEHLRQTQKMEAIGRLAGGVAHDFNNLLTAVIGYSEMALKKAALDSPIRNDILEVKKAGERAASLTNQLLAFGRKQMLQPKILDFNSVVENIGKMLRRLIGEHIDIAVIPEAKLGLVKADPGQIEQVIVNLALNARDAMPKGGKLTLETANVHLTDEYAYSHLEVTPGQYVMFALTDTGIGMDMKIMARIFEPFFTTKELGKGTGLGLAMVYGIIKQSGGHVAIYSEQGVGTTVKIYLPRIDETPSVASLQSNMAAPQKNHETILLVEDEAIVRDLTARILRDLGYEVIVASNGKEALEIAANNIEKIELVISDIVMPHMGGKELVEQLMLLKPQIKKIFMSGYTENSIVHQGVIDPTIDFLQKPFSYEAIATKVREVLDKKNGDEEKDTLV